MGIKLNQAGYERAASLIHAGKVDKTAAWSFSAEDGNALISEGKGDMAFFAVWHLGQHEGEDPKTKGCWAYPFGKGGQVYRSALTAIRQRAGQQKDQAILDAAGKLIEEIDGQGLTALSSVVFLEQDLTGLPDRILLAPRPVLRFRTADGEREVPVDDEAVNAVLGDFEAGGIDMVIDYEHQTLNSQKNGQPAPAAAWINKLVADTHGIWGVVKRWLKPASDYLKEGAYRYTSPVIHLDGEGRLRRISSVAITNLPATLGCQPLVLRYDAINPKEKEKENMEILEKLALTLGLKANATEDEVLAAQQAALKREPQKVEVVPPGLLKVLGLKDGATAAEAEAAAKRLTDTGVDAVSRTEFEQVATTLKDERFTNKWLQLTQAGLVTPAQRDEFKAAWDAGEEHFDRLVGVVKRMPKINLAQRLSDHLVSTDSGKKLQTAMLKEMADSPGIDSIEAMRRAALKNPELAAGYVGESQAHAVRAGQA
jgi:hypothetical protein